MKRNNIIAYNPNKKHRKLYSMGSSCIPNLPPTISRVVSEGSISKNNLLSNNPNNAESYNPTRGNLVNQAQSSNLINMNDHNSNRTFYFQ